MIRIKATLLYICVALAAATATAQRPSLNIELTSELQTNFKDGGFNFANWLQLYGEMPLSSNVKVELSTISTGMTNKEPLVADIHGYSNINNYDDVALTLAKASVAWKINGKHTLMAGVRYFDGDYFNSDLTTFFTNGSGAGYPTVGCNHNIGITPLSSVGFHYEFTDSLWGARASVYNGEGYRNFTGRNNVFRFCPKSDGVMIMAQGEYKPARNHYFLGLATHTKKGERGTEFWTYGEHHFSEAISGIAGYSHTFSSNDYCRHFVCIGAIVTTGAAQTGFQTNFINTSDGNEWDMELTCKLTLSDHLYLQPTMHVISTLKEWGAVGMMRFGFSY